MPVSPLLTSSSGDHDACMDSKRCRIYIDGEEDGEATLPKHMLTPGGMVKIVTETQHPYANNMDK